MADPSKDVTLLLNALSAGDQDSWKKLFSLVYQELHAMAHAAMRRERPDHTLQTTALVHEAYMRLVRDRDERWRNRVHFFSTAASAMRRILVDKARSRKAKKRGGGQRKKPLDEAIGLDQRITSLQDRFEDLEALDKALSKLSSLAGHGRKCTVVELRFFVGLTLEQTAEALDVSMATIKRDWEFTKAWLLREMREGLSNA